MKATAKFVCMATVLAIVAAVLAGVFVASLEDGVCEAFSVYDMISPRIIEFYETEIAEEKVVSSKSAKQIENIANRYAISVKKAQGVLIVYDFCNRTGGGVDFPSIAQMSESKVISLVKKRVKVYESSITEEKKNDLKVKAKENLGISL